MSNNCDTKTNPHETQSSADSCCPVEQSINQNCCPAEIAAEKWNKAFFCAMNETKVDILKEKIRKAWGPMLDKVGDATVEAMGVHWESIMAQAKAKGDLHENIKNIFQSAKK